MATKPILTPELIEQGVQRNANEYKARVQALRALHDEHAFNPTVDPTVLAKSAVEAGRAAVGLPAMHLSRHNEGDVRMAGRDLEAEAMAKSKGGKHATKEIDDESGEGPQGQAGDARVQARDTPFGVQTRAQGQEPQASNSNRDVAVWVEQTWEAESEEAVKALVPAGAKAIEVFQFWKATALVKA